MAALQLKTNISDPSLFLEDPDAWEKLARDNPGLDEAFDYTCPESVDDFLATLQSWDYAYPENWDSFRNGFARYDATADSYLAKHGVSAKPVNVPAAVEEEASDFTGYDPFESRLGDEELAWILEDSGIFYDYVAAFGLEEAFCDAAGELVFIPTGANEFYGLLEAAFPDAFGLGGDFSVDPRYVERLQAQHAEWQGVPAEFAALFDGPDAVVPEFLAFSPRAKTNLYGAYAAAPRKIPVAGMRQLLQGYRADFTAIGSGIELLGGDGDALKSLYASLLLALVNGDKGALEELPRILLSWEASLLQTAAGAAASLAEKQAGTAAAIAGKYDAVGVLVAETPGWYNPVGNVSFNDDWSLTVESAEELDKERSLLMDEISALETEKTAARADAEALDAAALDLQRRANYRAYQVMTAEGSPREEIDAFLLGLAENPDAIPPELEAIVAQAAGEKTLLYAEDTFEVAFYSGDFPAALEYAVADYRDKALPLIAVQAYEMAPYGTSVGGSMRILAESYQSKIRPPLVNEPPEGWTPVQIYDDGTLLSSWRFVRQKTGGAYAIRAYEADGGVSSEMVYDETDLASLRERVGRDGDLEKIRKAAAADPSLERIQEIGRDLADKLAPLQKLFQQASQANKSAELVADMKREAAKLLAEYGTLGPELHQALKEARRSIEALRRVLPDPESFEELDLEKLSDQLDQVAGWIEKDSLKTLCEEIASNAFAADSFLRWAQTDGVILLAAVAAGTLAMTGVGMGFAAAGYGAFLTTTGGMALTAGITGLAGVAGAEGGRYFSDKVFDTGVKANFQRYEAGELTIEELLGAYVSEWAVSAGTSFVFMGLGKYLAARLTVMTAHQNQLLAKAAKGILAAGEKIDEGFSALSKLPGPVGQMLNSICEEYLQEIAENIAEGVDPRLGALLSLLGCMKSGGPAGLTLASSQTTGANSVHLNFHFDAESETSLVAEIRERYKGLAYTLTRNGDGTFSLSLKAGSDANPKTVTATFTPSRVPAHWRAKIAEKYPGRDPEEVLANELGLERGASGGYRPKPGVDAQTVAAAWRGLGYGVRRLETQGGKTVLTVFHGEEEWSLALTEAAARSTSAAPEDAAGSILETYGGPADFEFSDGTRVVRVGAGQWAALEQETAAAARDKSLSIMGRDADSVRTVGKDGKRVIYVKEGSDWTRFSPEATHELQGQDHDRDGYSNTRSLAQQSTFSSTTEFGPIAENTARAVAEKRARGDLSPVRLLVVGAGNGAMETELKARFGDDVVIDHVSLNPVAPENAGAFRKQTVGDFLNVDLAPASYDRVISVYGTFHIDGDRQVEVFQKVIDALAPGGEAFLMLPGSPPNADARALAYFDRGLRAGLEAQGVTLSGLRVVTGAFNMLSNIAIRKNGDGPVELAQTLADAKEVHDNEAYYLAHPDEAPVDPRPAYRLSPGGPLVHVSMPVTDAELAPLRAAHDAFIAANGLELHFLKYSDSRKTNFERVYLGVFEGGTSFETAMHAYYANYGIEGQSETRAFLNGVPEVSAAVSSVPVFASRKLLLDILAENSPRSAALKAAILEEARNDPHLLDNLSLVARDGALIPYETYLPEIEANPALLLTVPAANRYSLERLLPAEAGKAWRERYDNLGIFSTYTSHAFELRPENDARQTVADLQELGFTSFELVPAGEGFELVARAPFGEMRIIVSPSDAAALARRGLVTRPETDTVVASDRASSLARAQDQAGFHTTREVAAETVKWVAQGMKREQIREHMAKKLAEAGVTLSSDTVDALNSMIDNALTAKACGILDRPGGITTRQLADLFAVLYVKDSPDVRIDKTELLHVPLVVQGTVDAFLLIQSARGTSVLTSDVKMAYLQALMHDSGKSYLDIRTTRGFTIPATSPVNPSGQDVVVKPGQTLREALDEAGINPAQWDTSYRPSERMTFTADAKGNRSGKEIVVEAGESVAEALARQGVPPNQFVTPAPFLTPILTHHDSSSVRHTLYQLEEWRVITGAEADLMWMSVQDHGYISSWIVMNSLGGVAIRSEVFSTHVPPEFVDFLAAFPALAKEIGKGRSAAEVMADPAFAEEVEKLRAAAGSLSALQLAMLVGDDVGQNDVAKYMAIHAMNPLAKNYSTHQLLFGESATGEKIPNWSKDSVFGVLFSHREELNLMLEPELAARTAATFDKSITWLNAPAGEPGLTQAILNDPELAASYAAWQANTGGSVKAWLDTVPVVLDGKPNPEFQKIQTRVKTEFYAFYAPNPRTGAPNAFSLGEAEPAVARTDLFPPLFRGDRAPADAASRRAVRDTDDEATVYDDSEFEETENDRTDPVTHDAEEIPAVADAAPETVLTGGQLRLQQRMGESFGEIHALVGNRLDRKLTVEEYEKFSEQIAAYDALLTALENRGDDVTVLRQDLETLRGEAERYAPTGAETTRQSPVLAKTETRRDKNFPAPRQDSQGDLFPPKPAVKLDIVDGLRVPHQAPFLVVNAANGSVANGDGVTINMNLLQQAIQAGLVPGGKIITNAEIRKALEDEIAVLEKKDPNQRSIFRLRSQLQNLDPDTILVQGIIPREILEASAANRPLTADEMKAMHVRALQRDVARGYNISPGTIAEQEVASELEANGVLPGPIVRDPSGKSEFIDAAGQKWDMKQFRTDPAANRNFDAAKTVAEISGEIAQGENVILDITELSFAHQAELLEAVEKAGLEGHVVWYPAKP